MAPRSPTPAGSSAHGCSTTSAAAGALRRSSPTAPRRPTPSRVACGRPRPAPPSPLAVRVWRGATVPEQPLLVVWEVVGHLELLLASGRVAERVGDSGSVFELTAAPARWRAAA